jgi:hypothetical protein
VSASEDPLFRFLLPMLPLTKIPGPNYYCFVLNFVLDMLFFEIWMIAVYLCMFVGFIFGHFLFVCVHAFGLWLNLCLVRLLIASCCACMMIL